MAARLDTLLGTTRISRLYADVRQNVNVRETAPGSVDVAFTDNQMEEILRTLEQVRDRGAQWADVAILVRGNEESLP